MGEATAPATRWTGWHRAAPGSPWREIGTADTEGGAWTLLLDRCQGGDFLVLRQGDGPPDRRPTLPRRRRF
jgi:hypothetical protein